MSDTEAISFDINTFTLGEAEDFEEKTGVTIEELFKMVEDDKPVPSKATTALIWLAKRRVDPAYTYEQARAIKFVDLSGTEDPPTEGADSPTNGSAPSAPSTHGAPPPPSAPSPTPTS